MRFNFFTALIFLVVFLTACDDLDPNTGTVVVNGDPNIAMQINMGDITRPDPDNPANSVTRAAIVVQLFDLSLDPEGRGIPLILEDGDTLTATSSAMPPETIDLELEESGPEPVYSAAFSKAMRNMAGETIVVALRKINPPPGITWFPVNDSPAPPFSDFYVDAPDTTFTISSNFAIDMPVYDPDADDPETEEDETVIETFTVGTLEAPGETVDIVWSPFGTDDDVSMAFETICPPLGNDAGGATSAVVNVPDNAGNPPESETGDDDGMATFNIDFFFPRVITDGVITAVGDIGQYDRTCTVQLGLRKRPRTVTFDSSELSSVELTFIQDIQTVPILIRTTPPVTSP